MTLFTCDQDGYLQNSGSPSLIQPAFRPLLDAATVLCQELANSSLICLYVRGSVAAGRAFLGSSDLDLVLISKDGEPAVTPDRQQISAFTSEFVSITSEVDLTVLQLAVLLESTEYARLRVYLKTQSVLLVGEDIRPRLPRFRPDGSLARYMHPDLDVELDYLSRIFSGDRTIDRSYGGMTRPTRFWCVWTMRTVLRAAGLLAMTRSGIYESDLKSCRDQASMLYPELAPLLHEAYTLALDPTDHPWVVTAFLQRLLPILLPKWREEVGTGKVESSG